MAEFSRVYSTSEVLQLLGEDKLLEQELGGAVDLEAESEDEDSGPEYDGPDADGSPDEYLTPSGLELVLQSLDVPSPAERDSLLLTESDLDEGFAESNEGSEEEDKSEKDSESDSNSGKVVTNSGSEEEV